jgi:hypothetical protein
LSFTPIDPGTLTWDVPLNAALTNIDSEATTAQSAANAAQTSANSAQSTANTAVTNAAAAQTTANTAVTNAAAAQTTANTGVTNAAAAQTTANTGVTNAATAQTTANAALPKAGGTMTGDISSNSHITLINPNTDPGGTGALAFIKSQAPTTHAITAFQADTTGLNNAAINATSNNANFSSVEVSGTETAHGTVKIAHLGYAAASDANAAAVSIDLQTTVGGVTGTAAQGIFITSTTDAAPTGNAINVRYNSQDRFVVKGGTGGGILGIGVATGHTPAGAIEVQQVDTSTIGLFMKAIAAGTDMVNLQDSGGAQRFQVTNAGATITRGSLLTTGNIQFGATSLQIGGGSGVIGITNATTNPTTNPTGGAILYATGGNLATRDSSGNVVSLVKQTVTGSRGGNAALASLLTALATIGFITDSTTA